ncbi:MAG: sulfatase [Kiritimatiellales bacterium]|nr:sulfatase [Kiritimatiellales bacterium]
MKRRNFLHMIMADAAFPIIGKAAKIGRNVLLICIDDIRPVMGCYGGAAKTPNFDAFAKSGAMFTRHYIQYPVCGPSRSSMLSGRRPDSTGIYGNNGTYAVSKQPDTHPTLPQLFLDNGYTTLSFGKVYHSKGRGKGFGWSEDPWKLDWTCYVNHTYDPTGKTKGRKNLPWRPAYEIYDGADSLHNDFQTAEKVIQALEKHKDEPFFIAGGFYKPHLPFVAPKRYWDLYTDAEIKKIDPASLPKNAADFAYKWAEIASYGDPEGHLFSGDNGVDDQNAKNMIHAYYACVSFIDAQLGRIFQALEKHKLTDSTAVVIWGDHGFHLGDHGRWAKHTQFEQSMRSPLMARFPGQQKIIGETRAIVESIDIYPTLCDFAGLKTPDFVEGQSFMSVVEGRSNGKQAAFSQIQPVGKPESRMMAYSVRTKDFRYVEWRDTSKGYELLYTELYDHRNDPEETVSIIGNPEYAGVIKAHAKLVEENYGSLKQ